MRRTIYAICICLLAVAAGSLVACADDELVKTGKEVVEGVPVTATLTLSGSPAADIVVDTRADASDWSDLTLFIFDKEGNYQQTVSTYDGTMKVVAGSGTESDEGDIYAVEFKTTSGEKKMLAIGNMHSAYWWVPDNIGKLEAAQRGEYTFEELKQMTYELKLEQSADAGSDSAGKPAFYKKISIVSFGQMMVSGWNEGLVIGTNGAVTEWGTLGIANRSVGVQMERSMAHVTFNIASTKENGEVETSSGKKTAKGTFIPGSYTIYNIPKVSYVTNFDENWARKLTPVATQADGGQAEVVDGQAFYNYVRDNVPSASEGKYTFDFYMPENIYEEVKKVDGDWVYADRERWTSSESEGTATSAWNKEWTYAPQTSTFVVISGVYNGKAGVGNDAVDVTANVEYTIHLGDFGEGGNMGNFSVERNCDYTYNVTVLGVDNIIVEAKREEKDYQHGAEGTVYDRQSVNYSYNLDAHYEQVFLEYNLSQIAKGLPSDGADEELDAAIAGQLMLVIQSEAMTYLANRRASISPYQVYADAVRGKSEAEAGDAAKAAKKEAMAGDMNGGNTPTKGFDYKWIEFWPQTGTDIATYPGISDWAREDKKEDGSADTWNEMDYYGDIGGSEENREFLMDVYDIIVEMGKTIKKIHNKETVTPGNESQREEGEILITKSGEDYVARFTAFVNEYYYLRHPLTGARVPTWSTFTNKIPREMIIAMSTDISTDGNSSYSKIHSYISQLAIQTFYSSNGTLNAFGIETYNETPLRGDDGFRFAPLVNDGSEWVGGQWVNKYTQDKYAENMNLSDTDGRGNQKTLIEYDEKSKPDWNTFINASKNGWANSKNATTDHIVHKLEKEAYQESYRYAYAACLSRNRDLNGNGKIDANEIRWFLASVNGYIRMGIGSNALSNAAQLYIADKSAMTHSGYATSYINDGALFYTSSKNDRRLYWAVERGSFGVDNRTWTGNNDPKPIRCIRNLPAGTLSAEAYDISQIEGVTAAPLFKYHAPSVNTPAILEFKGRLVAELYRDRVAGSLERHNEDNEANSYYDGIFVAEKDLDGSYALGDIIGYAYAEEGTDGNYVYEEKPMQNPCENYEEGGYRGWRVPNLVELMAMNNCEEITLQNETTCCTRFSNFNVRYGFNKSTYNETPYIMCLGENSGNSQPDKEKLTEKARVIRCVRDVPDGHKFPGE